MCRTKWVKERKKNCWKMKTLLNISEILTQIEFFAVMSRKLNIWSGKDDFLKRRYPINFHTLTQVQCGFCWQLSPKVREAFQNFKLFSPSVPLGILFNFFFQRKIVTRNRLIDHRKSHQSPNQKDEKYHTLHPSYKTLKKIVEIISL